MSDCAHIISFKNPLCCMTQGFPKFWNKIWSLYPEILLSRKVKLSEKCKEISWFEKPASASSVACLTHFFGRNFDPSGKSPGIGWWHRGKNWFWCSFSGKNPRDYTSLQSKWSEESLFIAYIGVSKGMLWCLKYAWSVWIESRVQISGLRVRVGVQLDDDDRPQRVSVFFKFFGGILRV